MKPCEECGEITEPCERVDSDPPEATPVMVRHKRWCSSCPLAIFGSECGPAVVVTARMYEMEFILK